MTEGCPYVRGETYARKRTPTFEFKAGATGYTGGGYARIRSRERREHTPGDGTDDVFVPVHRLAAVVWCYDADRPIAEVTEHLRAHDVHHQLEFPSANLPAHIEVVDHGEHAAMTNSAPSRTELRAYYEDAKRERDQGGDADDGCPECGEAVAAAVGGQRYCIEHATEHATDGQTVDLL